MRKESAPACEGSARWLARMYNARTRATTQVGRDGAIQAGHSPMLRNPKATVAPPPPHICDVCAVTRTNPLSLIHTIQITLPPKSNLALSHFLQRAVGPLAQVARRQLTSQLTTTWPYAPTKERHRRAHTRASSRWKAMQNHSAKHHRKSALPAR